MTVRIVYDTDGGHTYTDGDRKVPGVTTVLKPLSEHFYRGVDPAVMQRVATLGKAVHAMIHFDCKGTLDEDSIEGDLSDYFKDWCQFREQSGFKPVASELVVHSERYGYAGQIDLYGELNGELVHIDTKCTSCLMPTVGPQTSGYHLCLIEMGMAPKRRFALQLRSRFDQPWRLVEYKDPNDLRVFLSCLNIHKFKKANE